MRTPREILLEKHRHLEPRLEAIRRRVLQAEARRRDQESAASAWLVTLWRQLVLPCPRAWAGMTVAWAIILLLQVSANSRLTVPPGMLPKTTPEIRAQLKEQWLLRTELLGAASAEPTRSPSPIEPHSQALPGWSTAFQRPGYERV
jgi:hypothetical protein